MSKRSTMANTLAQRRASAANGDAFAYKSRWAPSLADPAETDKVASMLSNDISVALGSELDDLETGHEFRTALVRVFVRVIRMARQKEEAVLFFDEAVPGYTLMLLKKGIEAPAARSSKKMVSAPAPAFNPEKTSLDGTPEGQAASLMIESFFSRTGTQALTVEHPDVLFVFFPAEDLRKNVREMGFYFPS